MVVTVGAETFDLPGAGPVKRTHVYIGVALVVGILAMAYYRRATAGNDDVDQAVAELPPEVPGTTTPGLPPDEPEDVDPENRPPETNAEWTRRGIDYLMGLGYDPQTVATVLGKYLARQPVTAAEADIIRTVEGAMGRPPQGEYRIIMIGTPGTPTPPTPPPPPAGPPTIQRHHTVASGDTLWSIENRYRLPHDGRLYRANSTVIEAAARARGKTSSRGGPNSTPGWWIFPGTVLVIP